MEEAKDTTAAVEEEIPTEAAPEPEASPDQSEAAAADEAAAEAPAEAEAEAEAEAPEAETAEDLVNAAKAEVAEWRDKFMRLHAEWDTYRRRTSEQREEEKKRAAQKLVEALIPVLDDFERSVDFAEKNGEEGLLEGVQKVHAKLVDALVKNGVEVINPVGEAFNALEAQAVATIDNPNVPDETVQDVYQKGYKMGIKVIRPAMVTVTDGGPAREKPAED